MRSDKRRAGRVIRRARQREARTLRGLTLIAVGGINAAQAIAGMSAAFASFSHGIEWARRAEETGSPPDG
ncbi:hypothetical protein [Microbacterium sp. YY-01]|uniref:hypothetical protein n=1 Tax=Microbacterium sp. YY-01 TaxID=3421634 RepID=UPI003D175EA0